MVAVAAHRRSACAGRRRYEQTGPAHPEEQDEFGFRSPPAAFCPGPARSLVAERNRCRGGPQQVTDLAQVALTVLSARVSCGGYPRGSATHDETLRQEPASLRAPGGS